MRYMKFQTTWKAWKWVSADSASCLSQFTFQAHPTASNPSTPLLPCISVHRYRPRSSISLVSSGTVAIIIDRYPYIKRDYFSSNRRGGCKFLQTHTTGILYFRKNYSPGPGENIKVAIEWKVLGGPIHTKIIQFLRDSLRGDIQYWMV